MHKKSLHSVNELAGFFVDLVDHSLNYALSTAALPYQNTQPVLY